MIPYFRLLLPQEEVVAVVVETEKTEVLGVVRHTVIPLVLETLHQPRQAKEIMAVMTMTAAFLISGLSVVVVALLLQVLMAQQVGAATVALEPQIALLAHL
jgi:hypothetical protein